MLEISEHARVGYSTLKIIIPRLVKDKLIVIKRTVGKSHLYAINKGNPIVEGIYNLYNKINKEEIRKFK